MPSYTLSPEVDSLNTLTDTEVGYLNDSSDTTYVLYAIGSGTYYDYIGIGTPSTPSGQLVAIVPGARAKTNDGVGDLYLGMAWRSSGAWVRGSRLKFHPGSASWDNYTFPLAYLGSLSSLGDFAVGVADFYVYAESLKESYTPPSSQTLIAKAWATAYYLAAASASAPSAPSGTITTTQQPTQTATVSALVETWQAGYWLGCTIEMRIYNSSDVSGSDPPTGVEPIWSGKTRTTLGYGNGSDPTTAAISMTPSVIIPNGTYITFVRISRDLADGAAYQELYWSAWAKSASAWTINIPVPSTPTSLTATKNDSGGYVAISVTAPTTSGYTSSSGLCTVERSDDLGGTWQAIYNMTDVPITLGGGATAMGVDYQAVPGSTTTQYRARVSAIYTSSGMRYASAWKTITGVTAPALYHGWRFIAIDEPSATWTGASVEGPLEESSGQERTVFRPLDGAANVVVSGPSLGIRGRIKFWAHGSTAIAKLEALLRQTGVLIMTTAYGDTRIIAWASEPSWTRDGSSSDEVREAQVDYVETDLS